VQPVTAIVAAIGNESRLETSYNFHPKKQAKALNAVRRSLGINNEEAAA